MRNRQREKGFGHLGLMLVVVVLAVIGFTGWQVLKKNSTGSMPTIDASGNIVNYDHAASLALTNGRCSRAGSVPIGPPMPLNQISSILPYGITVGGHVTPIDHQYYNGLNPSAPRDTYDVIAPADGTIVDIEHRGSVANTPLHSVDIPSSDEYRLVIAHSCSFLTYVDLVTSLDNNLKSKLPAGWNPLHSGSGVNIPVTKGEIIGHIGGQTLDFAVWDLSKPLKGFVNFAADYGNAEPWKDFTAPASQYFDSSVKNQVLAKYLRTAAPIDGKIDYDIDGKLIGTWFLQGSGGYHAKNNTAQNYWVGHLSIAPDALAPSFYIASIGDYGTYTSPTSNNMDPASTSNGGAEQFVIKSASPDPATAGVGTGLVKYELVQKQYLLPNGQQWSGMNFTTDMTLQPSSGRTLGTIIAQLTGTRTLKFEVFPGKTASQVSDFDSNAKTYTR